MLSAELNLAVPCFASLLALEVKREWVSAARGAPVPSPGFVPLQFLGFEPTTGQINKLQLVSKSDLDPLEQGLLLMLPLAPPSALPVFVLWFQRSQWCLFLGKKQFASSVLR